MPRRNLAPWLGLVCCAALAVRIAALWFDRDALLFDTGGLDTPEYLTMASGFWSGDWPGRKAFFWAPGYPLLLGLLAAVSSSPWWFKAVQIGLGVATSALVGRLADLLFQRRSVTLLSAGGAALYGPLVYYDLQISPATLDTFLLVLLAVLVLRLESQHRARSWWTVGAIGLVAAASAVTRGGVLLALPALLWWLWRHGASGSAASARVRVAHCALVLAPMLAALGSVAAHNWRYDRPFEDPVSARDERARGLAPVSNNLGINLLIGNRPDLYESNHVEHPLCFVAYKGALDEPSRHGYWSESSKSRYLRRQTARWIARHPGQWLTLLGRKVSELLHGQEISRDTSIYAARLDNPIIAALIWNGGLAFPSGLLIPFAMVGIAAAARRGRGHSVVWALLATQCVFVLCFFVTTRYRLPLCALSIPFAAHAAVALGDALRSRELPRAVRVAAPLALLLVTSNVGLREQPRQHPAFEYVHRGLVLAERGEPERAEAQWNAALEHDPGAPTAHFNLARMYARRAELARAAQHYEAGLRRAPDAYAAREAYARVLLDQRRADEALDQLLHALSAAPSRELRSTACQLGRSVSRWLPLRCP